MITFTAIVTGYIYVHLIKYKPLDVVAEITNQDFIAVISYLKDKPGNVFFFFLFGYCQKSPNQ